MVQPRVKAHNLFGGARRPGGDARAGVLDGQGGGRLNTKFRYLGSNSHTQKLYERIQMQEHGFEPWTLRWIWGIFTTKLVWAHNLLVRMYVSTIYEVEIRWIVTA